MIVPGPAPFVDGPLVSIRIAATERGPGGRDQTSPAVGWPYRQESPLDRRILRSQEVNMLNLENLRARVRGGGFKPFKLHLSDGLELAVGHPELILVTRQVVVVATDDGVTYTVDPLHIVAISEVTPGPPADRAAP